MLLAVVLVITLTACSRSSANDESETTADVATTTAPTISTTHADAVTTTAGQSVPTAGTTIDSSITEPDGRERTYRLYIPPGLPVGPAPLLIALHGGTGWGTQFETNSGFDDLADANGFIVAYPDGIEIPLLRGKVWNGGDCCGLAAQDRQDVNDVGFISDLIDIIEDDYPIDETRVYATGHSNGAIMSYRLACELSDRIVAVGFQAGSLEIDDCRPDRPVSVLHIHGSADTNIPLDGGHGSGISNTDFNSPQASVETLAMLDGCDPRVDSGDEENPDVAYRIWEPCDEGTTVEMVIVEGANHAWMGHEATRVQGEIVGAPYMGYDSSAAIWDFLTAHPRQ